MNKKSLLVLVSVLALLLMGGIGTGYAAVGGVCSNCHTMHYSEDGVDLTTGGPHAVLLKNNCLGCHTTGAADPLNDTDNTPYVASSTSAFSDDVCLAGGFFPATMGTGNNNDNHHGIGNLSDPAGKATGSFYTQGIDGLGCGGINGCHGNETDVSDMDAISGGHHNTSATYRMLYVGGVAVDGSSAEDYEELIIKTPATAVVSSGTGQNVNIYCAGTPTGATISDLCAKCHGDFHGSGASSNTQNATLEWIRHPTENVIPTGWAIGVTTYTPVGADYKNHPPGYDGATLDITEKRVTCLSCHRAHGTANDDLLRWAYSTQVAGGGTTYGCLGCHDAQR